MTESTSSTLLRCAAVQFQHAPAGLPFDSSAFPFGAEAVSAGVDSSRDYNMFRVERFCEQAAEQSVEVIAFPEMCVSGYWHVRHFDREHVERIAEPLDGPTTNTVAEWAARFQMTIGVGFIEAASDGQFYNTYAVCMPDGGVARHRKLHCFISAHMASGDSYTVFDTPHGWRMGVLICYDNNLVENARITALQGAELLLAPHQTGGCNSGSPFAMGVVDRAIWDAREQNPDAIEAELKGDKGRGWLMRWLPARAHDNGMFLVFSNGVGPDDNEVRTGNAMILDPYGRTLGETWAAGDEMVVADLDRSLRPRSTGARWMRARRPELYGPITEPTGSEEETRSVRFDHLPND